LKISVLIIMWQMNIKYVIVNVNYDKMWPEKEVGFAGQDRHAVPFNV